MLPVVAMVVQMLVCAPSTAHAPLAEQHPSALAPASNFANDLPFAEQTAAESTAAPHLTTPKHVEPEAPATLLPATPNQSLVVFVVGLQSDRYVLHRSSLPPPLSI